MLKTNKNQSDNLNIIGSLLHKPKNWKPNINLLPYMSKENKELITNFYLNKVLKLLTTRNQSLTNQIKELFEPKTVELKEIINLLKQKQVMREIKTRRIVKEKPKFTENNTQIKKLYTFSLKRDDESKKLYYYLYDGKKKRKFLETKSLFDYLLEEIEKEKNIVLMGWDFLNIHNLKPLLQESLSRGFYPTIKGGGKKSGKPLKIVGCYLKGNSIILKDVKNFHLEESKENKKLDKLYKEIQKIAKNTQNKYQLNLFDKNISTLIRIAWMDFWKDFEKNQTIYGWERIWSFNKNENDFIRQSYQGGYLDLFNEQKYQGLVSDWDFKKFYAWIMAKNSFPISRPLWINHPQDFFGEKWKTDFYGFYECEVECLPENIYPFFTYRDDDKKSYAYRHGKYQAVLFSEEIKFYWNHTPHIKIEVKSGYTFQKKEYIFTKWIRKLYYKAIKGDELAKIMMNSLYGMFGQEKSQISLVWSSKKTSDTINVINFKDKNKKNVYLNLTPQTKYYGHKFTNVAIASAITSYGRIALWHALLNNWDKALYCSTDGLVIKGNQINKQPCSKCNFDFVPILGNCGEIEKEGEYQGFTSLAPHVYAFKNDKNKLVGKGGLKKLNNNNFDFLFENEKNTKELLKKAYKSQKREIDFDKMLNEIDNRAKKQLVAGKWEIYN